MFINSSGVIAVTTLALLGFPVTPAIPAAPGPPATLATARAATAALPHSPRLLGELAASSGGIRATGGAVRGIDVAAFQHPHRARINWAAVAAAGYKFAAVKATEGDYYVNPWARTDLAAAKRAGLYVTAYHFASPNVSGGAAQARYAVRLGRYTTGERMLPFMLDIEYDPYVNSDHTNECYGLSRAKMRAWIAAFVSATRSLTGQLPVIYTTAGWWDTCTGRSRTFGADPMWVAAYGFARPPLPAGWRTWMLWQYTSNGTVPGVDSAGGTDLSTFNTSMVGLVDPGTQRSRPGTTVSLQVNSLERAGGRPLSYRATGLPPRLAITRAGTITGRVSGPSKTYRVTISATNAARAAGSVSFGWQVSARQTGSAKAPADASPGPAISKHRAA